MRERVKFFYDNASVLPINKYLVGFYGINVKEALDKMGRDATITNEAVYNKMIGNKELYNKHLAQFLTTHASSDKYEVELKWTAVNVSIPNVQAETVSDVNIDSVKNINYPLIKKHTNTGKIKIDIVENRTMTMYHFFNAIQNRFFYPKALRPRSSFQKLGMYIIVLGNDVVTKIEKSGDNSYLSVDESSNVPLQVFEFNSIVPLGISEISLSQTIPTKKLEYNVTFEAPNLFQSSFKTISEFKGLRDNTSGRQFLKVENENTDNGGISVGGEYATRITKTEANKNEPLKTVFELTKEELITSSNQYFPKDV